MKTRLRKWLQNWLREEKDPQEILLITVGAILMQELHSSRTFRRKISGTIFEKRLKELLDDTK